MLFQRPPYMAPSTYRRWRRRQFRLLVLTVALLALMVGLVVRGLMLLPPKDPKMAVAPTATATATATRAPTPTPHPPPPAPTIQAAGGILVDLSTGAVLFTQHADDQLPMASTTKVMTALLALERGRLNQPVTIGADAVAEGAGDNSRMGVSQGEVLSLGDMLYGLMLPSGDDAAVAIADAIGGNQQNFVALMNAMARFLGLTHTHFVNPDGLDAEGQYTSASDLAKLTRRALAIQQFAFIVSTPEAKIPATGQHKAYDLVNTNLLLIGYPGADGIKTGTTPAAGACLVFSATRADHQLLGIILGAPDQNSRFQEARALLDWGFVVVSGG